MCWPIDIIAAAQRRIESKLDLVARIEDVDESLWIKADSYSLVFALTFIAERLLDHYQIRDLRFRTSCEGKPVYLDAIWVGQAVSRKPSIPGKWKTCRRWAKPPPCRCAM